MEGCRVSSAASLDISSDFPSNENSVTVSRREEPSSRKPRVPTRIGVHPCRVRTVGD